MSRVHWLMGACFLLIAATRALAAPPVALTPEKPPIFAVLSSVEKKTLTFVFWRHEIQVRTMVKQVMENGETKTISYLEPALVQLPRQVTVSQDDVIGTTVSGETIATGKAWKDLVGKSMLLLEAEAPLDPVYQAALAPETVLVQHKGAEPRATPAPYPDGSLPVAQPTEGGSATAPEASPSTTEPNPAATQPPPGTPSPAELASAQQAIQPELVKLKIKIRPAPFVNPLLQSALPGFMFFPVDDDDPAITAKRRPRKLIVKKPDGSSTTIAHDEESVFDLLRDQFTVLTDADARKYVRTHLLLVEARHPTFTYGPIEKISVKPTDKGGRTASGEAPITGGGRSDETRPAAFTLNVTFNKEGKVSGGKRGARAQ